MRIDSLSIYRFETKLASPWITAYGADYTVEQVLFCLRSGGVEGWGEASPLNLPTYSPEYSRGVFEINRDIFAKQLLGEDIESGDDLQTRFSSIKGHYFAKSGFDLAWWDLASKLAGQPMWKFIGGTNRHPEAGADFGYQKSIDILLQKIDDVKAIAPRIKLKYGPGWGIEVIREVRKNFPDLVFHIDCNSAYTLDDLPMFKELDQYNLAMFEQPLTHDDLIDHATLQREIKTPICLDESLTTPDKARKAIQIGSCKYFNLKTGRLGGITNILKVCALAREAGIPCWIGGMLETGIGRRARLAVASLPEIGYPSDICPPRPSKLLKTPIAFDPGTMHYTLDDTTPGSGADVDIESVRDQILEEFHLDK